jgi:hypothetical protein
MEERVTQEQRTVFAKVTTGLEELANNAHESNLVVQDLTKKMEEQEHESRSSVWARGHHEHRHLHHDPHRGRKTGHGSQSPSCSRPTSKISAALPTVPEPAARKDGPRSSAEQAKRGEYLQSAVHYAVTALAAHKFDAMRTGFSRWASYAYATKLKQKRKITGDTATKLEGREQAYAEQGCEPEGSKQVTTVQARLAAAWTYHKRSYAQAGKADPMVKAWKQTHASTEVSKATSDGTGAGNTAGEAVAVEQKSPALRLSAKASPRIPATQVTTLPTAPARKTVGTRAARAGSGTKNAASHPASCGDAPAK